MLYLYFLCIGLDLLSLGDYFSTEIGLKKKGIKEGNPLMQKWIARYCGLLIRLYYPWIIFFYSSPPFLFLRFLELWFAFSLGVLSSNILTLYFNKKHTFLFGFDEELISLCDKWGKQYWNEIKEVNL